MATAEGQFIALKQITLDCEDEKVAELSNGMVFKSQFDVCKNQTMNYLLGPDGDLLSTLAAEENGNQTRNAIDKLLEILNSEQAIEQQRDQALERSQMAETDAA